jgi:hypothetical protein
VCVPAATQVIVCRLDETPAPGQLPPSRHPDGTLRWVGAPYSLTTLRLLP